jgi:FkbM family methyltransferase
VSSILNRLRTAYLRRKSIREFQNLSFSQEGEDLILASFFGGKSGGFYVDVGAHHPLRFSNTYYFYSRGWEGMNIDAMPGAMAIFDRIRPRDINLEFAVSDERQVLTYYAFQEPAFNTFSKKLADRYEGVYKEKLLFKRDITTYTLAEILDRHLPRGRNIDFISVDVEGLDYQVLTSNDWQKYAPKIVLVEEHDIRGRSLAEINELQIALFLRTHGYEVFSRTLNTLIFGKSAELFRDQRSLTQRSEHEDPVLP